MEHRVTGNTGIVDQNFDGADFRFDFLADFGARFKVGDIGQINRNVKPFCFAIRFPLVDNFRLDAAVIDCDRTPTCGGQRLDHRRAQAPNTTGNDCNSRH